MQFATLLFYGISSFFLGLVALATGGALVLQSIFDPSRPVVGGSHEPWQTFLEALTLVVPLVFVLLAVFSIVRPSSDAPATAAEIRQLVAALEARNPNGPPADRQSPAYRRS
jgi:hypothetical protein